MTIRVDTCTRFDMNHIISFVRELSVGSETTVKRIITVVRSSVSIPSFPFDFSLYRRHDDSRRLPKTQDTVDRPRRANTSSHTVDY
jgi:hypothetical protein